MRGEGAGGGICRGRCRRRLGGGRPRQRPWEVDQALARALGHAAVLADPTAQRLDRARQVDQEGRLHGELTEARESALVPAVTAVARTWTLSSSFSQASMPGACGLQQGPTRSSSRVRSTFTRLRTWRYGHWATPCLRHRFLNCEWFGVRCFIAESGWREKKVRKRRRTWVPPRPHALAASSNGRSCS